MTTPTALSELARTPNGGLKPFRTIACRNTPLGEVQAFLGALAAALSIFRDRFMLEVEGLQWSYGGHLYWFRREHTLTSWRWVEGTRPEDIAEVLTARAFPRAFMYECRLRV